MVRVRSQLDQAEPGFGRLRVNQPRATPQDFGSDIGVALEQGGREMLDEAQRRIRVQSILQEKRRKAEEDAYLTELETEATLRAASLFEERSTAAPLGGGDFFKDFDKSLSESLPEVGEAVRGAKGYGGLSPGAEEKKQELFSNLRRQYGVRAITFEHNARVKHSTDTLNTAVDDAYDYVQKTGDYDAAKARVDVLFERFGESIPSLASEENRRKVDEQLATRWVLSKSPTEQVDILLGRGAAGASADAEGREIPPPPPLDAGVLAPGVASALTVAADRGGVPADTLARFMMLESGGRTNPPKSSTGAQGPFQFTRRTAAQYGLTDPNDLEASADATVRLMKDNAASLSRRLGRAPTQAELYLAHQQGAGGAAALLANPDANAIEVMAELTGDVRVAQTAILANGGNEDMTAGEFAGMWEDRFNRAGVGMPQATPAVVGGLPQIPGERVIDYAVETGTPVDNLPAKTRQTLLEAAISDQSRERAESARSRKAVEDALATQAALARVQSVRDGAGTFDPKSTDDKEAVALGYSAFNARLPNDMQPGERAARTAAFAAEVGMVPQQMQSEVRGSLRSGDADRVAAASEILSRLNDANPALLGDFSDGDIQVGLEVAELTRAGLVPKEAAARVLDAQRTMPKDVRELRRQTYRQEKYGGSNQAALEGAFDAGMFSSSPDAGDVARAEFNALVERFYETSPTGNIDTARSAAAAVMKRTWGVSSVDGSKRLMKYAPEAVYGVGRDDATWMREQLGSELQAVGMWARPVEDMIDDGSITLVPSPGTTRTDSTGRPMVRYQVQYDGAEGPTVLLGPDGRPFLWRPDWNLTPQKAEEDADVQAKVERARRMRDTLLGVQRVNEADEQRRIDRAADVEKKRAINSGPTVR